MSLHRPHAPRRRIAAYVLALVIIVSLAAGVVGTVALLTSGDSASACSAIETRHECRLRKEAELHGSASAR